MTEGKQLWYFRQSVDYFHAAVPPPDVVVDLKSSRRPPEAESVSDPPDRAKNTKCWVTTWRAALGRGKGTTCYLVTSRGCFTYFSLVSSDHEMEITQIRSHRGNETAINMIWLQLYLNDLIWWEITVWTSRETNMGKKPSLGLKQLQSCDDRSVNQKKLVSPSVCRSSSLFCCVL